MWTKWPLIYINALLTEMTTSPARSARWNRVQAPRRKAETTALHASIYNPLLQSFRKAVTRPQCLNSPSVHLLCCSQSHSPCHQLSRSRNSSDATTTYDFILLPYTMFIAILGKGCPACNCGLGARPQWTRHLRPDSLMCAYPRNGHGGGAVELGVIKARLFGDIGLSPLDKQSL